MVVVLAKVFVRRFTSSLTLFLHSTEMRSRRRQWNECKYNRPRADYSTHGSVPTEPPP